MDYCKNIAHLFFKPKTAPRNREASEPEQHRKLSVASGHAAIYLEGLVRAPEGERNLEDMAAVVEGADHQRLHHFVSQSPWSHEEVTAWVSREANGLLGGHPDSHLILDESCFTKKGKASAGVASQYNGRLGKNDNCQVGVFAALAAGNRVALVDMDLYLPEVWTQDPARCEAAGIPEHKRLFRTKPQMALELIRRQRSLGTRYQWISMDAGYGKNVSLLQALDDEGETFVADVACNRNIRLQDPCPAATPGRGGRIGKIRTGVAAQTVQDWAQAQPEDVWVAFRRRESHRGPLRGKFLNARVHVWDGEEENARLWHLVVWKPEGDTKEIHYVLSNAAADTPGLDLARMAASRYWVERAFQDAKGAVGMDEYQLRGWLGWQHHMALVCLAMLFVLREKITGGDETPLLSAEDVVWLLEKYLPRPEVSGEEITLAMARRHRRRQADIDSRKRRMNQDVVDCL